MVSQFDNAPEDDVSIDVSDGTNEFEDCYVFGKVVR